MPYLGVMEAVRARLEGNDPKYVAQLPDILKNWDHEQPDRNEGINQEALVDAFLRSDRFAYVGRMRVPIYFFDIEGARFEGIYPSLSYEILDITPRYNEFIYQSDQYRGDEYNIPIQTTRQDVTDNIDGTDLGVYPRAIYRRAVEHPMDIMVELRCYANDPIISALLVEYIYNVFPPRYFIRVPQKDGSYRDWDVLFENYRDIDKRTAVRAGTPGVQREYAKVFTYRVEGYMDNTDTTDMVNLIRKRDINISNNLYVPASAVASPVVWRPNIAYLLKQAVVPLSTASNFQFVCVSAGTSSNEIEPVWPTKIGDQILDGSVIWQAV